MVYKTTNTTAAGSTFNHVFDTWENVTGYLAKKIEEGQTMLIERLPDEKFKVGDRVFAGKANIGGGQYDNTHGTLIDIDPDDEQAKYYVETEKWGTLWYAGVSEPVRETIEEVLLRAPVGTRYASKSGPSNGVLDEDSPIVLPRGNAYSVTSFPRLNPIEGMFERNWGGSQYADQFTIQYPDGSQYKG